MTATEIDPVCGMPVLPQEAITAEYAGHSWRFCSLLCRDRFLAEPSIYAAAPTPGALDPARARRIAYFSMEIAIDAAVHTYAGGLGVLAGDMLRACADLRIPIVGVTLLSRAGYFDQTIDAEGRQTESPAPWRPERLLDPPSGSVEVAIEGRPVEVRGWQRDIRGSGGYRVPVLLLDTDVDGNAESDRRLTDDLYGGDERHRLAQEVVLGVGGRRLLRALGYTNITTFHLNEGHAALAAVELLREATRGPGAPGSLDEVRARCVFTTHTPVEAGHDKFDYELVHRVAGRLLPDEFLRMLAGRDHLNMTRLGLNLSGYVNGVATRHGEVMESMFPGYHVHHITNGVHSRTWVAPELGALYDRHMPGWADDPAMLRKAFGLPVEELRTAHRTAKAHLLEVIQDRVSRRLEPDHLLIGFARRATAYKRADLILSDLSRLVDIAARAGPIQLVFSGKAHPRDDAGKEMIRRIVDASYRLGDRVPIVYLENHGLDLAARLVAGVDLWLNTPQRPLEASGTSGMKAALNGVPSVSVLDGWWIEGHIEGVTGWSIDEATTGASDLGDGAESLFRKLEDMIVPLFYGAPDQWVHVMRQAIGLNGSYFNTHRMAMQYVTNAYLVDRTG